MELQGETEGAGAISGVREGIEKGVTGCALTKPARHGKRGLGKEGNWEDGGKNPRTFRAALPEKSVPRPFPAEGCSGRAATRIAMQMNF